VTLLAYGRPFWPLFLHVLGAMTLFGATLGATLLTVAAWRRPVPALARATFLTLLAAALPAWVLMRACAEWISSSEGFSGHDDPSWLDVGSGIADIGLLLLLVTTGLAYWWSRGGPAIVGRVVAGLSGVYLGLLCVAWLAMSAKW
jgi:hypothetical protein